MSVIGRHRLQQFGRAAEKRGIFVQYCMAYTRFALASVELPAVDQIRVTDDYAVDVEKMRSYSVNLYTGTSSMLAAAVGLLFCVIYLDGEAARDEIIALDAQTLQLRHRFGRGLLNNAQQLTVVRDELYVCDTNNHRLQVFSLTGEHRRSVTGEWRSPEQLCFVKDRLYLVEQKPPDADIAAKTSAFPLQGLRILVLSLQGDILQVVTHPTEPTAEFRSMLCFDHKLLARYYYYAESLSPRRCAGFTLGKFGMLALQGL